jgi:pilus assembly protein CpaB
MMKLLKNKTILGIVAILLGIAVCFILSPIYNKSLEKKTSIIRIMHTVPKGSMISSEDIKEVEVGSYNLPEAAITTSENVVGKYAVTDLYKDDYLLPEKLSVLPLSNNDYLEELDGLHGAMSITLQSFASGLSGKLLGGDIVSVIATDNNSNTVIPAELKYVKVLACTTAEGADIDPGTVNKDTESRENIPTTVTLLVNDQQAKSLANLEVTQKIHISLIYRGEEDTVNQYLVQQEAILEQLRIAAEAAVEINETNDTNNNIEQDEEGGFDD